MTEQGADLGRYDDWLAWLRDRAAADHDIRVVWIGGSAVTGGWDEHSDLDVEVLTVPGEAVAAYRRLLDLALEDFPVDHVWELPVETWPDGRQAFVNLLPRAGDLSRPTMIIDLHVSDLADEHRFVDVRRHGEPLVLHDPDGLVELRPADEAVALHLQFAVGSLVRLLRTKHSPARHNFGLRYLDTDLPPGYADRVTALLPGPGLAERSRAAFAWQDELLAELRE